MEMDFNLPPEGAIRYLEQKYPQGSQRWMDLLDKAHDRAFVVAGMMDVDMVNDVRISLIKSAQEGTPYQQWADDIMPMLKKKGWIETPSNSPTSSQQAGGEKKAGNAYRLKTIYQTNMATAHEAGRRAVMVDKRTGTDRDPFPYWMYSAVLDKKTRPSHRSLDGTVMKKTDPAWDSIYPPNGYNCRCTVIELTRGQAQRYGYEVISSEGKLGKRVHELPNGRQATQTTFDLPNGSQFATDIGFNNAPEILPIQNLFDKAVLSEPVMASKVLSRVLEQPRIMDEVVDEFGKFAEPLIDAIPPVNATGSGRRMRLSGEHHHVGVIPESIVTKLANEGVSLPTSVLTVTDEDVVHAMRADKHNPVPKAWYLDLPRHLQAPDAVLLDTLNGDDAILFVYDIQNPANSAERYKAVVKIGKKDKIRVEGERHKLRLLHVRTTQIIEDVSSLGQASYVLIDGAL